MYHICAIMFLNVLYDTLMRNRLLNQTLPDDLLPLLQRLGSDLSAARRIRRMSQEDLAQRLNVSRKLVARMERGDPSVSFGAYVMSAWVMNLSDNLLDMFAQERDPVFQREARLALPQRVRAKTKPGDDLDF